jgi:hypothetical protein
MLLRGDASGVTHSVIVAKEEGQSRGWEVIVNQGRACRVVNSETRSPKSETRPKLEIRNPKRSQSRRDCITQPRVARRALPWELRRTEPQPCKGCITAPTTNGMCGVARGEGDKRGNPFRVECVSASASQGSARRATLGSAISSFQDVSTLHFSLVTRAGAAGTPNGSGRSAIQGSTSNGDQASRNSPAGS